MSSHRGNRLVGVARTVEASSGLDVVDRALRPLTSLLTRTPRSRAVLHGHWLGHAVHPLLTDVPLGMWMSGTLLDLVGGPQARPASSRLIGIGLVAAIPTAVTGLAEWDAIDDQRSRRTGIVHAVTNSAALSLYTASWLARRRDRQARAATLAVAGGLAASVGGFFGGHLTEARKISSRHPAFEHG